MKTKNIYSEEMKKDFAESFANPGSILRGAPFFSWNNKLDAKQLCWQIEIFKQMGIGGFHMHPRTGMNTPYMSDEFIAVVKECVNKAKKEGMFAWLYDEDRWPSGFAGGLVTIDEQYRARHLLLTPVSYEMDKEGKSVNISGAFGARVGKGRLLAKYAVVLKDGYLQNYTRLKENKKVPANAVTWFAYLEISKPSPWFNNQTYVDTLNTKAIERFIEVTHEKYKTVVGKEFGKVIPGIFTDEPQFINKTTLGFANEQKDIILPFTDDFPETYNTAYSEDILDKLPELIWELPDKKASVSRYRYHDHIAERFASAFADTIGNWCIKNGFALTGHMMEEPTLRSQTAALGEAMRSYRSFQIPGIDMLCDWREYTTAKQAQSAVHQYGCPGMLSELYGVTDWDFDFTGHKAQGDWQAALGVTVRVHHLAWVSMAGEAKRDYPASISYQSPWYKQYKIVEDHFARVNSALTRGKPHVKVGVIHPVESYWLCFGPEDQTSLERENREYSFEKTCEWLLFGLQDFDYICESLLPKQNRKQNGNQFIVGEMKYDIVIVPPMHSIRSSTLTRLDKFMKAGGKLIFAGEVPELVDAVPSDKAKKLAKKAIQIQFSQASLLGELEDVREIDIRNQKGNPARAILYQMRSDDDFRYLFICNTQKEGKSQVCKVRLRGSWQLTLLDTSTGAIEKIAAKHENGRTEIDWVFHPHGHLLLKMEPSSISEGRKLSHASLDEAHIESSTLIKLSDPVPVTLDEPNVLLLDQAEWRVNGGKWREREEILRLDNLARKEFGLDPRSGNIPQPWIEPEDRTVLGVLDLRFKVQCDIPVKSLKLAIEEPESCKILLDDQNVSNADNGWWVDEAIRTVLIPELSSGEHELVISISYHKKTNIEWCYLLGDFGVELKGRHARIVDPVTKLAFGDWTSQNLPFYTGNITYHCDFEITESEHLDVRIAHFSGAMVGVSLDGKTCPGIAYAPFETNLGTVSPGKHKLDLTLYANRYNAFGSLHLAKRRIWAGPSAWRSQGDEWCYEYMLRTLGILAAPRIRRLE